MVSFYSEMDCDIELLNLNVKEYFETYMYSNIEVRQPTRYKIAFIFDKDNFNEALTVLKDCTNKFEDNIRVLCIKYGIKINFEVDVFRHIIRLKYKD